MHTLCVHAAHTHICSIVHSIYTLHNTRPRPCTQSHKQGEWGGWVHPLHWVTLGFWAIHSECKGTLISMIKVYSPDLSILCSLCVVWASCCSDGVYCNFNHKRGLREYYVRDGCNHKYLIHFGLYWWSCNSQLHFTTSEVCACSLYYIGWATCSYLATCT